MTAIPTERTLRTCRLLRDCVVKKFYWHCQSVNVIFYSQYFATEAAARKARQTNALTWTRH